MSARHRLVSLWSKSKTIEYLDPALYRQDKNKRILFLYAYDTFRVDGRRIYKNEIVHMMTASFVVKKLQNLGQSISTSSMTLYQPYLT